MATLVSVPGLDDLARDPSQAAALPSEAARALFGQAVLVQAALLPHVWRQDSLPAAQRPANEDWIPLDEAAALVRRPKSWLLRRSPRPAWLKQLGRKTFVVNRPGLLRWFDSRPS